MGHFMEKIKTIYLAGKITNNNWRSQIVDDPSILTTGTTHDSDPTSTWPIKENAILGKFDYVGPYFVNASHFSGNYTELGENTHGTDGVVEWDHCGAERSAESERRVRYLAVTSIFNADLVYAWIDSTDCYGTIAEIGVAHALQKIVVIAGPERFDDLWFVYQMANFTDFKWQSPGSALVKYLEYVRFIASLSPIEYEFLNCWVKRPDNNHLELKPQYDVLDGKYRVDFAFPELKVAVELDGFESHSSTEDIASDRRRQREIEREGWRFIRFGGKEIHQNVTACVEETVEFCNQVLAQQRKD